MVVTNIRCGSMLSICTCRATLEAGVPRRQWSGASARASISNLWKRILKYLMPSLFGLDPDLDRYWQVRPDYMTGHRGSTLSSSRGHGLPAQHYFRRLCPEIWLGIGSPQFAHAVDNSPQVHGILWSPTSEELLSHLGHCWAKPAGAAPKGVIAPILRNDMTLRS